MHNDQMRRGASEVVTSNLVPWPKDSTLKCVFFICVAADAQEIENSHHEEEKVIERDWHIKYTHEGKFKRQFYFCFFSVYLEKKMIAKDMNQKEHLEVRSL